MEKITRFLIKLVKQAAKMITPEFEIKAKDDNGDLVTNFDLEIEKFLIGQLKKYYPNFDVVSEEFNSQKTVTENCFVIDPIDGTINFGHKLPLWGIQVACVKNGQPCSSVIYLPKLKELYCADISGAFCNGKQIFVQEEGKPILMAVDGGKTGQSICALEEAHIQFRQTKVSCVNYAWTAKGSFSGVIFQRDNPWDYVPGEYIVKQAGGVVFDSENKHIAASNQKSMEILQKYCGNHK